MTDEQFDALVARLEVQATRHPELYKLKLAAFASLGYVYIALVVVGLLAATVGLVAILALGKALILVKFVIPIIAAIGLVFRSLWVTMRVPQGLELRRRDHRALFAAIDAIRAAADAPRVHTVLLTNEVNAAVIQVPRLGMFGWQRNFLILGLPLLQLLSLEEAKAVLAHEFGHLSGAHGRFGAWIYRVRLGWARLAQQLEVRSHWGSFLFVPFFQWYAPKFAAYSFVQARRQELEADLLAARAVGPAAIASSLVRLDLKSQDLARSFWPGILSAADRDPAPTDLPYTRLLRPEARAFVGQPEQELKQALERKTSTADTHPCLRDRIAALALQPEIPLPIAESAATVLLGPRLAELVAHFDGEWQRNVKIWWRGRHEHVTNGRAKLATYSARGTATLDDLELYEYAMLVEEFEDPAKAFELYKALVMERGAMRGAKFAYARHLLQRGDESAIKLLDEVMIDVPELTMQGCELLVMYLRSHDREAEAQPYVNRYLVRRDVEQQLLIDRETLRVSDTWLPHTLPAVSVALLKESLQRDPEVKLALLVRKKTPENQPPLHVVGILRRTKFLRRGGDRANGELIDRLAREIQIPEPVLFIWLNGKQWEFLNLFEVIENAKLV